jgi:hypothetical protein
MLEEWMEWLSQQEQHRCGSEGWSDHNKYI